MFVLMVYSFLWRVVITHWFRPFLPLSVDAQYDSCCGFVEPLRRQFRIERGVANYAAIPGTCRWNVDFDAPVNLAEVH
jgi:hypothetical protein